MGAGQIGYGPLWRVDGPPPLPPVYGLLQAAERPAAGVRLIPDVDERGVDRWGNGVEVYPYPPDCAEVFDPCAPGTVQEAKGFGSDLEHPQFGAMTVWVPVSCTAQSIGDQEAYKARAVAVLAAVEGAAVARELMTGDKMPLQPNFSDGDGVFPNGDSVTTPQRGLALLEAEIARSCRQGLIHLSPQLATFLRDRWAIDEKDGVLRTANGIVVINDFGYVDGATPNTHAGPVGDEEWMYATGPIDIRRSEVFVVPENVSEALDRGLGATNDRTNEITYRAERLYLADWDTHVQAAVRVDPCRTEC
jgi:hypothetical protein